MDVRPETDCWVQVGESDAKRVLHRRASTATTATAMRDCFIVRRDGTVEAHRRDYDTITPHRGPPDRREAALDQRRGFYYLRQPDEAGEGLTTGPEYRHHPFEHGGGRPHPLCRGRDGRGAPLLGFLSISRCGSVTLRNCFVSGHKTYSTIGAAGKPVNMGSYDLSANQVINLRLIGVRMNHILDSTRWGVIGTNFCKNILLEEIACSRGWTRTRGSPAPPTIRRCSWAGGLNAIGRGTCWSSDSPLWGVHQSHSVQRHLGGRRGHPQLPLGAIRRANVLAAPHPRVQRRCTLTSLSLLHAPEIRIDGRHRDDSNHPGV